MKDPKAQSQAESGAQSEAQLAVFEHNLRNLLQQSYRPLVSERRHSLEALFLERHAQLWPAQAQSELPVRRFGRTILVRYATVLAAAGLLLFLGWTLSDKSRSSGSSENSSVAQGTPVIGVGSQDFGQTGNGGLQQSEILNNSAGLAAGVANSGGSGESGATRQTVLDPEHQNAVSKDNGDGAQVLAETGATAPLAAEQDGSLRTDSGARLVMRIASALDSDADSETGKGAAATEEVRLVLLRDQALPNPAFPEWRDFPGITLAAVPQAQGAEGQDSPTEKTEQEVSDSASQELVWPDIKPGRYSVFVQTEGYAPVSFKRVRLRAGESVELLAELERGVSLTGRVIDADTGLGIAGAEVLSENDAPYFLLPLEIMGPEGSLHSRAVTDNEGHFVIQHASSEEHWLRVVAPSYAADWVETNDGPALFKLEREGILFGQVDGEDGTPLMGATVVVSLMSRGNPRLAAGRVLTDQQGNYEFGLLPSGSAILLNLGLEAEGAPAKAPELRQISVVAGKRQRQDFRRALNSPVVFGEIRSEHDELLPGYSLIFAWKEAGDSGEIRFESVVADEQGKYRMALPARNYMVFGSKMMAADQFALGQIVLTEGNLTEFNARVPSGAVTGQLRAADSGLDLALEGVAVAVGWQAPGSEWDYFGFAITDHAGRFRLPGMSTGRYRMTAYPAWPYAPLVSEVIEIPAQGENDVEPDLIMLLEKAQRLVVECDWSGEPLAAEKNLDQSLGLQVRVSTTGGSEFSQLAAPAWEPNSFGKRLFVAGLGPGNYTLTLERPGWKPEQRSVTLLKGERGEVLLKVSFSRTGE